MLPPNYSRKFRYLDGSWPKKKKKKYNFMNAEDPSFLRNKTNLKKKKKKKG